MRGILAAIPLLLAPAVAAAGVNDATVAILSPSAGACVNNGGEVFAGGVLGGFAGPPIRPLSVNLRLTESNGNGTPDPLTVRIDVDGVQALERTFDPVAEGVAFETGPIDIFAIEDGENRRITAHAIIGQTDAQQSVVFDLDRTAPSVVADAELPDPSVCRPQPPPVPYHVTDAFDATPTVVERIETDGCTVRRVIRVGDDCGNTQEVSAQSRQAPPPNSISVAWGGIAEAARVGVGALTYTITAPNACVDSIQSVLTRDGQDVGPVIYGNEITDAGAYVAQISIASCGGAPISATRRFTILAKPSADAGGPYRTVQNRPVRLCATDSFAPPELLGIIGYQWDINNDGYFDAFEGRTECIDFGAQLQDGNYTVRVKVEAGNHTFAEDTAEVTIDDVTPTCALVVPPGPFPEGELVEFDATGSAAGNDEERIELYEWHFGDGSPDQLAAGLGTTIHRYDSPGDFTYSVTVHDIDSSCTTSGMLHINDVAPICNSVTVLGADRLVEGTPVQFTVDAVPGSFSDPIVNYTWFYGDSPAPDAGPFNVGPSHAYADQGEYAIRVVVDDQDSQTTCQEVTAVVQDLSPVAEVEGPRVAVEGEQVTFLAGQTREGGAADRLTELEWDFGDGSDLVSTVPAVREQTHTFETDGEFDVALTATDEDNGTTATQRIRVLDVSPVAEFTVAYVDEREVGAEGVALSLDGGASVPGSFADPIAGYRWDFGDGETAEGADLDSVDHAWPDNGTYVVRLTVVDEDGSEATAEHIVTIENVAPTVRIEVEENTVDVNVPYTYRAIVTDVAADVASVDWEMGDQNTYRNRSEVTHTYNVQGRRVITVTVDDGDGGTVTGTLIVEVTTGRPRLVFHGPYTGVEGDELVVEFEADAAEIEPGVYDGPIQVPQPQLPPGARWEEINGPNPSAHKAYRITWTPTYVDAGQTTFLVRAQAPSGQSRDRDVSIEVVEAGTPYLAAGATVNGEGRVTVVAYGRDPLNHALTFRPTAEINIGAGVGGLAASEDGRYVFAASPGAGGVAVVDMSASPPAFGRLVRTGVDCASVAVGGGRAYAVNAGENTLTIIDADTLKVIRTLNLAPLSRPTDVVYLPAGFGGAEDGLAAPRLFVVGGRGGHVLALDPAAAERGGNGAIVAQKRLGGALQRIAADADSGWLHVSDAKTRNLYAFQADAFLADAANAEITSHVLDFAAQDLAAGDGAVWAASTGGLVEIAGMQPPVVHADQDGRTVTAVSASTFPGGGIVVLGGQGLEHRDADLALVLHTSGRPSTRRLTSFVNLQ
jgi:YVTN family beta-propeller protein